MHLSIQKADCAYISRRSYTCDIYILFLIPVSHRVMLYWLQLSHKVGVVHTEKYTKNRHL